MEKEIKIIQISAVPLPENYKNEAIVFGLGEDGRVYFWDEEFGDWQLNIPLAKREEQKVIEEAVKS